VNLNDLAYHPQKPPLPSLKMRGRLTRYLLSPPLARRGRGG